MLSQQLYEDLKKLLARHYHTSIDTLQFQAVGGGSINQTGKLTFSKPHALFCKINKATTFPHLFLKEREGLEALAPNAAQSGCQAHAD